MGVQKHFSSSVVRQITNLTTSSSSVMANSQISKQFLDFFPELLEILKNSPILEELPDMQDWIVKIVDYNVQGGKMNRGIAVVESYSYLTDNNRGKSENCYSFGMGC